MTTSRVVEACARIAELHPFVWKLAWEALHRLHFLLPHDKSYHALRHFIAARPGGLFLDVGANDGISVLSFRRFDKDYRILALEPNPLLEPALKKIKSADARMDYRMVGAGSAPMHLQFFVPIYRGIVLHTFTSASREQVEASVAGSYGKSIAAAAEIKPFEGEVIRLDDLGVDPAIIKIDAEGFDHDVLVGLRATIERARPFIITEIAGIDYDKIKNYFDERRYVLLVYDIAADRFSLDIDSCRSSTSGQRNFFAVPQERLASIPLAGGVPRPRSQSADTESRIRNQNAIPDQIAFDSSPPGAAPMVADARHRVLGLAPPRD
jgi:FkbM family methyltransferase